MFYGAKDSIPINRNHFTLQKNKLNNDQPDGSCDTQDWSVVLKHESAYKINNIGFQSPLNSEPEFFYSSISLNFYAIYFYEGVFLIQIPRSFFILRTDFKN